MILRFELTMPNVGSWNGVDTGRKDGCYLFREVTKSQADELDGKSFYYDFGDGWGASVRVSKNRRSKSNGFRGYDWMVDEILQHGRILTRQQRKELEAGVELIAEERNEQINKHGRTIQSDVSVNKSYQLSAAAIGLIVETPNNGWHGMRPNDWDLDVWRKMAAKTYKERLIIAGALIAAEIDRLNAIEEMEATNG